MVSEPTNVCLTSVWQNITLQLGVVCAECHEVLHACSLCPQNLCSTLTHKLSDMVIHMRRAIPLFSRGSLGIPFMSGSTFHVSYNEQCHVSGTYISSGPWKLPENYMESQFPGKKRLSSPNASLRCPCVCVCIARLNLFV